MDLLPNIDQKALQEKVNEYAMKGAIESIKEFYSGHNSPFRKAIDAQLAKVEVKGIELPDILAVLNDSIAREIELIANTAIVNTIIPHVKRFFTRADASMAMSDFLRKFIELTDPEEQDDLSIEVRKHEKYEWLDVVLSTPENSYSLTFHEDWEAKKAGKKLYMLLSLPGGHGKQSTMKLKVDDVTVEVPFTQNILQDKVIGFFAGLLIARTKITMDCTDFSEDMFPEKCRCH